MNRRHVSPPTPVVLVLGRILGAVLAGTGTLANIAIKDLWRGSTPADLSLTPRLRVFGIGVVASLVLADALILAAAILGLM